MRHLITLLLVIIAIPCLSQKIKKNEIDKFTKKRKIETSSVTIYGSDMAIRPNKVSCYFRSVDSTYFLGLDGFNTAAGVVGNFDKLYILLSNDSTIILNAKGGLQSYEMYNSTKSYNYEYLITKKLIEQLSTLKAKSMRIYYSDTYSDIDLKHTDALLSLCLIFLKEINK
jgi:hypothetical protein